jgi:hypothetical protein
MPFTDADVIAALTASGNNPVQAAGMLREVMASAPGKISGDPQIQYATAYTFAPTRDALSELVVDLAGGDGPPMQEAREEAFYSFGSLPGSYRQFEKYWTWPPGWDTELWWRAENYTEGVRPDGSTQFELVLRSPPTVARPYSLFVTTKDNGEKEDLPFSRIGLDYGIPTVLGAKLVPVGLVKQYKRNKATFEALLRALMAMIPGTYGSITTDKWYNEEAKEFVIKNAAGQKTAFSIQEYKKGKPELSADVRGTTAIEIEQKGMRQEVLPRILSSTTLENAQTLIDGYVAFSEIPANLVGTNPLLAPHIDASQMVARNIDPTSYMTGEMITAGEIERLGLAEGDLVVRIERKPWGNTRWVDKLAHFYRVAAVDGDITNGKGGLWVRPYRKDKYARPYYVDVDAEVPEEDLLLDVIVGLSAKNVLLLQKVPEGQQRVPVPP